MNLANIETLLTDVIDGIGPIGPELADKYSTREICFEIAKSPGSRN